MSSREEVFQLEMSLLNNTAPDYVVVVWLFIDFVEERVSIL